MTVLQYSFWVALLLLAYIYLGYPLLVYMLSRWRVQEVRKGAYQPSVSILTAAHNEAAEIGKTIRNKLTLRYPTAKLEVIVISDASTDETDEIVKSYARESGNRVKMLRQPRRQGKTAALNMAALEAKGEILVFADANSIYEEDALEKLVSNFSDPGVGYVTGKMIYVDADGTLVGDGCTAFMKYENHLRVLETRLGSIVGVDGGIDGIRRELFITMDADQLPDFVLPLSVVKRGYRVVYEPRAVLREHALTNRRDEYAMRVRVALRAFWALAAMKALLNPLRYGIYSWQLLSHKALRYLAFVPLSLVLLLNVPLWTEGQLYRVTLLVQAGFYLVAWVASLGDTRVRVPAFLRLPQYFVLLNIACAHAFWKFARRHKQAVWTPRTG